MIHSRVSEHCTTENNTASSTNIATAAHLAVTFPGKSYFIDDDDDPCLLHAPTGKANNERVTCPNTCFKFFHTKLFTLPKA